MHGQLVVLHVVVLRDQRLDLLGGHDDGLVIVLLHSVSGHSWPRGLSYEGSKDVLDALWLT